MKTIRILSFILLFVSLALPSFGQNKKKSTDKLARKEETKEIKAFIKTFVSRNTVSPSDTLMLTYRLYTTREVSEISTDGKPFLRQFHATELPSRGRKYTEEKIKGVAYKVIDVQKIVLQPKDQGVCVISKRTFYLHYDTPTGKIGYDFWGDPYEQVTTKSVEAESDEVKIHSMNYVEI